jgi:sulfonate transport system permease protein
MAQLESPYKLPISRVSTPQGRVARLFTGVLRGSLGLVVPVAILVLWSVASKHEWAPPQILPAPDMVRDTLVDELRTGDLWANVQISLERVLAGFAIGSASGLALGAAMGLSRRLEDYIYPLFNALSQVPVRGWVPLAMLFLGIGESFKIVLIAFATLLPVAVNTVRGFRGVPRAYIEVGSTFRFTRGQYLRRIVLPAAVPSIFVGLRYGLTQAWLSLVTVELLASSEGLGFLIVWARQLFQLDLVLVAILAVGVVGLVLDKSLASVEKRFLRWKPVSASSTTNGRTR